MAEFGMNVSLQDEEEQEWTLVESKKSRRRRETVAVRGRGVLSNKSKKTSIVNRENTKVNGAATNCMQSLLDNLSKFSIKECVCLGLGSLSSSISRKQYELLKLIKKNLNIPVQIFDPVFTLKDLQVFTNDNITIVEDRQGQYKATQKTLYYMPHCGESLYNNLLSENWKNLDDVVILGNSFSFYHMTLSDSVLKKKAPLLFYSLDICSEIDIGSIGDGNVFNNMSIIAFNKEMLEKQIDAYWANAPLTVTKVTC